MRTSAAPGGRRPSTSSPPRISSRGRSTRWPISPRPNKRCACGPAFDRLAQRRRHRRHSRRRRAVRRCQSAGRAAGAAADRADRLQPVLRKFDPDIDVFFGRRAPARMAATMDCPVINAGDGTNEHPTQALLDALTIRRNFGRIEGIKVAICGDIKHSRVARSNALLLRRLGAEVRLAGPPALLPGDLQGSGDIDRAIEGADVVMMLRVQRERLEEELGDAPGEFLRLYGLTRDRFARAASNAIVMHPGPMNRGVEIDGVLADDPHRLFIALQVTMGVAVRMACLEAAIA